MDQVSARLTPNNWDIARLNSEGPAGRAAWSESFAARAFGLALTFQAPEFFDQVRAIDSGDLDLDATARSYVRRDQGRRVEAVSLFLRRAADAGPDASAIKIAVWNTGSKAWWVDGGLDAGQPQRALRRDAVDTISVGAIRVARRGLGRCVDPTCTDAHGAVLRASASKRDYCAACERKTRRPRDEGDAEISFFNSLVPAVLVAAQDRPRMRRTRRS